MMRYPVAMRTRVLLAGLLLAAWASGLEAAPKAKTVLVPFKVFPQNYSLSAEEGPLKPEKTARELRYYRLPAVRRFYTLAAEGYAAFTFSLEPSGSTVEFKLEKAAAPLSLVGELPSGSQPKSICFAPDGRHAFVAQLSGAGIDVYQVQPFERLGEIDIPPAGNRSTGFVEFALLPWRDELWVSQMTTGQIHVLGLSDHKYRSSFASGGVWSKVILADPRLPYAFVSNWLSENVSVIDVATREVVRKMACKGIPRGMALDHQARHLYVANFSNGSIERFDLDSFKRDKILAWGRGAKRHLLIHPEKDLLFATDMELGELWVVNLADDSLLKRIPVGPKLNTMDMSPDGRYIFISSRGTNNPETYLIKGPDFGSLSVVDTQTLEKTDWVWGRNQPTGVAVHPSLPLVAFTDFLDNNVELYDYSGLSGGILPGPVSAMAQ